MTMGTPPKNPVPITMEYTPENPKPDFPVGHPRWRPGKVKWWFESESHWTSADKPVLPNAITSAYWNAKAAMAFGDRIKAVDDAFASGDINASRLAWLTLKNDLPFVLAGYMGIMVKNYLLCWLPMLKKAYTLTSIPSGSGEIHTSTNPTDEVEEAML